MKNDLLSALIYFYGNRHNPVTWIQLVPSTGSVEGFVTTITHISIIRPEIETIVIKEIYMDHVRYREFVRRNNADFPFKEVGGHREERK